MLKSRILFTSIRPLIVFQKQVIQTRSFTALACTVKESITCHPHTDFCLSFNHNFQISRHYAKGKDKKKEKGKAKVHVNESELTEIVNLSSMKNQMEKPLEQLKEDFIKYLSLRSTAGSIERIQVSLDGKEHTLQELAQIVRKNPKTIVINMSGFPQAIPAALKSIAKSGMNLNPQQDGTTLFIPVPKVTKEHRENLSKSAKQLFVKCKDSIREVQMKYIKQLKKKEGISQDTARSAETQMIAIADTFISQAERVLESKQKELTGAE